MARSGLRPDARARRGLSARRAAALGVVQGVCELLPVSSSAHVGLLARDLPTTRRRGLEVALHGGTALALPWVVRDITPRIPRSPAFHVAAAAPPIVVGAVAADAIERRAAGPRAIAAGLLAGGAALALADRAAVARNSHPATALRHGDRPAADAAVADGLALGLAQATALLPGVSRRGATLAAARARGFSREAAGDLSWAAGIPVMVAAAARGVAFAASRGELRADLPALTVGAAAAAVTVAALGPARPAIDRVPYGVWAAWRSALAVAAGTLGR